MLAEDGGVEGLQLLEGGRLGEAGLMEGLAEGLIVAAGREIQRGHGSWSGAETVGS
jgi:hypothetical protein